MNHKFKKTEKIFFALFVLFSTSAKAQNVTLLNQEEDVRILIGERLVNFEGFLLKSVERKVRGTAKFLLRFRGNGIPPGVFVREVAFGDFGSGGKTERNVIHGNSGGSEFFVCSIN